MSTIAERARMEAEQAEAETPDEQEAAEEEETPPEPEPEPEPEPAQPPVTDTMAEDIFAALDKYDETHMKSFLKKVGPLHAQFLPCPLCITRGFVQPAAAGPVTSDREESILRQIGRTPGPELLESNQYERCQACNGWGEVLTGAQKDVSRAAMCNACGGKGYLLRTNVTPIQPAQAAPPYPGAGQTFTPLPSGVADGWGRPAGHPHWGLDPAQVGS